MIEKRVGTADPFISGLLEEEKNEKINCFSNAPGRFCGHASIGECPEC